VGSRRAWWTGAEAMRRIVARGDRLRRRAPRPALRASAQELAFGAHDGDLDEVAPVVLLRAVAHFIAAEVDAAHAFHRPRDALGRGRAAGPPQAFDQHPRGEVA